MIMVSLYSLTTILNDIVWIVKWCLGEEKLYLQKQLYNNPFDVISAI